MFVAGVNDSPAAIVALTLSFATLLPVCALALWKTADRDHNGDERSERASVDLNRLRACKRFMELFIVMSEAEGV